MKRIKIIFYITTLSVLCFIHVFLKAAWADDAPTVPAAASDQTNQDIGPAPVAVGAGAYYPSGCVPTIALPVYPESQSCAAAYSVFYPQPVDETQAPAQNGAAPANATEAPAATTVSTAPETTSTSSTSTTATYNYYSVPGAYYVYPSETNMAPAGYLAVFATGVALGAAYNNHYYYPYYHPYYYRPYHPYYPYGPYYPYQSHTSWHGEYGNAGYTRGPNGGAYHWNTNGYSGGGYCYHGNCGHTNNWDGGNVNKNTQTNLTTQAAPKDQAGHLSNAPAKKQAKPYHPTSNNLGTKNDHPRQKAPALQGNRPHRGPVEGMPRHGLEGGHGLRR